MRRPMGLFLLLPLLGLAAGRPAQARPADAPRPSAGSFARPAGGLVVPSAVSTAARADGEVEVLIGLVDGQADTAEAAALSAASARVAAEVGADYREEELRVVRRFDQLPILHAWVSRHGLARLAADPRVATIERVVMVYPLGAAMSPLAMPEARVTVGADKVYERWGLDGTGVSVAVLDTGIDNPHKDFEGAILDQQCFSQGSRSCAPSNLPKSDNAQDEYGHGTAVSSMVLGRGVTKGTNEAGQQISALGIAPRAGLLAVRVFRDNGGAYDPDIVAGLDWVLTKQKPLNVRAVNMSLGGGAELGSNCDNNHATVKAAFARLVGKGVAVIVATGNGGNPDRVAFPACISNAISVGATYDKSYTGPARAAGGGTWCSGQTKPDILTVACFTDRGRSLDLLAPGLIISHAALGGALGHGAGTSYATPIVAGIAALMFQAKPDLRASDIERILQATGTDVAHPESGETLKLVNAFKALESIMPAVEPSPTAVSPTATRTATATATTPPTDEPGPTFTDEPSPTGTATRTATTAPTTPATQAPTGGKAFLPVLRKE